MEHNQQRRTTLSPLFDWRVAIRDSRAAIDGQARRVRPVDAHECQRRLVLPECDDSRTRDEPWKVDRVRGVEPSSKTMAGCCATPASKASRRATPPPHPRPAHRRPPSRRLDYPRPGAGHEDVIEGVIESEQPSPTGAAVATRAVGAQNLVGHYVDAVRAQRRQRRSRTIGIVARQTKALLDEGVSSDVVAEALDILVARRLHPSVLPTLILEAAAGPPAPRPSGAMRYGRGMTTAQILEATKDLT